MTASSTLTAIREQQWAETIDEHPELAISVGYAPSRAWTDWSAAGVARRRSALERRRDDLAAIDAEQLTGEEAIDWRVATDEVMRSLAVAQFPNEALAVDPVNGPQIWVPNTLAELAPALDGDAEAYLTRLEAIPELLDGVCEALRSGARVGVTLPEVVARLVPAQIAKLLEPDGLDERFVAPLAGAIPEAADEARHLAEAVVVPALADLASVYRDEYLPYARDEVGIGALPDGEAWYAVLAAWFTTTDLDPAELQRIGEQELGLIAGRMAELRGRLDEAGIDPDRPGAESAGALVAGYDELCRRIDDRLPELFGILPRLGFVVEEMPSAIAPEAPAAYYLPGSARLGRLGTFLVNTSQLDQRAGREAVALAMHECIPGHHLQFALAQENEALSAVRRHAHVDAYIEGWALYAESLADDLGFFDGDPLAEYGALTFAAWRAARLVVDPGLHVFGWTRAQAIDFMVERTSRPRGDLAVEVDRYIAWPGQALGYKVGERSIRGLRERAVAAGIGLAPFHDQVLSHGPIPLAVLDDVVGEWIDANRA